MKLPKTVYILGSGPNGVGHYHEIPEDAYVIGINRAAAIPFDLKVPFKVSMWVIADSDVIKKPYYEALQRNFSGVRCYSTEVQELIQDHHGDFVWEMAIPKIGTTTYVPVESKDKIGGSVAGSALWIAYQMGAVNAIFCGVDMGGFHDYDSRLPEDHHHGEVWKQRDGLDSQITYFRENYHMNISTLSETQLRSLSRSEIEANQNRSNLLRPDTFHQNQV